MICGFRPLRTAAAACLATALAAATPAHSAVVYSFGAVTSEASVRNVGTVISAVNFGTPAPAVTVNGIAFAANTVSNLSGWTISGSDFSSQFAPGSPLDTLMSGLVFIPGSSGTLALNGLTAGSTYLLQLFLANNINATGSPTRVTIQGVTDTENTGFANGNAYYLDAQFTATGPSESVTFTDVGAREVLNAYALEAMDSVPEPVSLAVLGAGLLGLAGVRRPR